MYRLFLFLAKESRKKFKIYTQKLYKVPNLHTKQTNYM